MREIQVSQGLVKLSGTISNYKCTRAEASFFFTDSDRSKLSVIAIAAGLAGLSGPAISTAANATSAGEDADYVEFDLDGKTVKGWVWRSPFKGGDLVEVAAEWRDGHYETGGIARPADRLIALHPHCSRGIARHIKNGIKLWFVFTTVLLALGIPFLLSGMDDDLKNVFLHRKEGSLSLSVATYIAVTLYLFFGLIAIGLVRKWMPFVRLSEKIFLTLGFSDSANIDLVKSSKAQRKPDDASEYGTFYFRY